MYKVRFISGFSVLLVRESNLILNLNNVNFNEVSFNDPLKLHFPLNKSVHVVVIKQCFIYVIGYCWILEWKTYFSLHTITLLATFKKWYTCRWILLLDICYLTERDSINTEQHSLIQRFVLHEHMWFQFLLKFLDLNQFRICPYSTPWLYVEKKESKLQMQIWMLKFLLQNLDSTR